MKPLCFLALSAALVLSVAPARADSLSDLPPAGETLDGYAWLRLRGTLQRDFPIDTAGSRAGQTAWLETRLRVGGAWRPLAPVAIRAEGDLVNGIVAGDTTGIGTGPGTDTLLYPLDGHNFYKGGDLRQLYVTWRSALGEFRVGQMTSSWGLGLVANDGDGEPAFGDKRFGDRVERVLFATRPLSKLDLPRAWKLLTIALALDPFVYRDAYASWRDGDIANQIAGSVFTHSRDLTIGAYVAARSQTDRADPFHPERPRTTLDAAVYDLWLGGTFAKIDRYRRFSVEGEVALITGSTTRPYFDETRNGADIQSAGGAVRLRYDDRETKLHVTSELGYASGDNDPHDKTVRSFSFNPDYKVGLVLFDQVLPRMSARAADRAADPSLVAVPAPGLRYVPTQGAVTNAVYFNPVIRADLADDVEVRGGYLLAWSAGDLVDPFSSQLRGGFNATYGGKSPGSRALGHEIDGAVRFRIDLGGRAKLFLGAEAGAFFAGHAFDGVGGDSLGTVWTARALADARY